MAIHSLRDALRFFFGGDKKEKPLFKTEKEAYEFCLGVYNKTGGPTNELRRAYEFYLKNYNDDGCSEHFRPENNPDSASR
jgi:dihydroorotase